MWNQNKNWKWIIKKKFNTQKFFKKLGQKEKLKMKILKMKIFKPLP
jgi:hypothetical protein